MGTREDMMDGGQGCFPLSVVAVSGVPLCWFPAPLSRVARGGQVVGARGVGYIIGEKACVWGTPDFKNRRLIGVKHDLGFGCAAFKVPSVCDGNASCPASPSLGSFYQTDPHPFPLW